MKQRSRNTPGSSDQTAKAVDPEKRKRLPIWPADVTLAERDYDILTQENRTEGRGWPLVARAGMAHVAAMAAPVAVALALPAGPLVSVPLTAIAALLLAREGRALESCVHWFAHGVFDRRDRKLNDMVGDILAAGPVGQRVAAFEDIHVPQHHNRTFTDKDPCGVRMTAHPDVKAGGLPKIARTLRRVPRDALDFYRNVGSRPSMLAGRLAAQALWLTPAIKLVGLEPALAAWAVLELLSQALLAVMRSFAEAREHDYADAGPDSVLERTFDHRGFWGWLLHPAFDDLHAWHHAAMAVPPWRLKQLRRKLLASNPAIGAAVRYRQGLLDEPKAYVARTASNDNAPMVGPVNDNLLEAGREPAGIVATTKGGV